MSMLDDLKKMNKVEKVEPASKPKKLAVKLKKVGRKPDGDRAMTPYERLKKHRAKKKEMKNDQ